MYDKTPPPTTGTRNSEEDQIYQEYQYPLVSVGDTSNEQRGFSRARRKFGGAVPYDLQEMLYKGCSLMSIQFTSNYQ